jgi:hypothetical protein
MGRLRKTFDLYYCMAGDPIRIMRTSHAMAPSALYGKWVGLRIFCLVPKLPKLSIYDGAPMGVHE